MFFRKKKSKELTIEQSISRLKELRVKIDVLIYMAINESVKTKIERINEVIKYMAPSTHETAKHIEKKLSDSLDDLKVAIANNKDIKRVESILEAVEIQLIQRNFYK